MNPRERNRGIDLIKKCPICEIAFSKPYDLSYKAWEKQKYCSRLCAASLRIGLPNLHIKPIQSIADRLWDKVNKDGPLHPRLGTKCWVWTGALAPKGYGAINECGKSRKTLRTHRVAWTVINGEIPNNLWVLHKCDNPPCCNPDHLYLGTSDQNIDDMHSRRRNKNPPRFYGEDHGNAKFTNDKVRTIRKSYINGNTVTELSKVYETSPAQISHIVNYKTWRHID